MDVHIYIFHAGNKLFRAQITVHIMHQLCDVAQIRIAKYIFIHLFHLNFDYES